MREYTEFFFFISKKKTGKLYKTPEIKDKNYQ